MIIFCVLLVIFFILIKRYGDRRAVIYVTYSIYRDTADAFYDYREIMAGDTYQIDYVTLYINEIKDGIVSFSVTRGELYDEGGNEIKSGVIKKGESIHFTIKDGDGTLGVDK